MRIIYMKVTGATGKEFARPANISNHHTVLARTYRRKIIILGSRLSWNLFQTGLRLSCRKFQMNGEKSKICIFFNNLSVNISINTMYIIYKCISMCEYEKYYILCRIWHEIVRNSTKKIPSPILKLIPNGLRLSWPIMKLIPNPKSSPISSCQYGKT